MKPEIVKQIIRDSAALLEKTAELSEQAEQVPELKQKVATLASQNASMLKSANDLSSSLAARVEKFADRLVEHGTLNKEHKTAFVEAVRQDPTQIVDVMEKLASQSSIQEIGQGGKAASSEKTTDPIVQFAMGE
jgi:polyhydroxyalkanoate synthesis regulator phasin